MLSWQIPNNAQLFFEALTDIVRKEMIEGQESVVSVYCFISTNVEG